jgi:hypothetical protein
MTYHQFATDDNQPYGSCEIFYMDQCLACDYAKVQLAAGHEPPNYPQGWYWQACSPGCIPGSDPNGPFETEEEAMIGANVYRGEA